MTHFKAITFKFFLVILSGNIFVDCFIHTRIIKDYFKEYSIQHLTLLTCISKKDRIQLYKAVNDHEKDFILTVSNIESTNLLSLLYTKYKRLGIGVDGDCKNIHKILIQAGRHGLFTIKHRWLLLTKRLAFEDLFLNVTLNIDAHIRVVNFNSEANIGSNETYLFYDIYNPASERGGSLKITYLGLWSTLYGYQVKSSDLIVWNRKDLTGVTFKSLITLPDPWSGNLDEYLQSDENREKNSYNRFHYRQVQACLNHYNANLTKYWITKYGYLTSNGDFDGMVGEEQRRRIDFGLSPLAFRKDRSEVLTYGRQSCLLQSQFFFRNPKSINSWQIFGRPLEKAVWKYVILFSLGTIGIIKLSLSYEKWKRHQSLDSSWTYCALCVLGSFCQQGLGTGSSFVSGKIAIIFTLLLSTLIYQFYSASLVSSLLNIPLVLIKSIQDLLDSNMDIGVENTDLNKQYFKQEEKLGRDTPAFRLYKKFIKGRENIGFQNFTDGLNLMKKGKYAFHVENAKAYVYIKKFFKQGEVCDISTIKLYNPIWTYMNYPKHSPFKDLFDVCLHRIGSSGVMARDQEFWSSKKPVGVYSLNIETNLQEFYPALVIVCAGVILSLIILVIEKLVYFWTQNREKFVDNTKATQDKVGWIEGQISFVN